MVTILTQAGESGAKSDGWVLRRNRSVSSPERGTDAHSAEARFFVRRSQVCNSKWGFCRSATRFTMQSDAEAFIMELEIVWRNPMQVEKAEHRLERISSDQFGTLYSIINPDVAQEFELIQGAA